MLGQNLEDLVLAQRGADDERGLDEPAQAVGPSSAGRGEAPALLDEDHALGRRRDRPCEGSGGLEVRRPEPAPAGEGDEAERADRTPWISTGTTMSEPIPSVGDACIRLSAGSVPGLRPGSWHPAARSDETTAPPVAMAERTSASPSG